MAAARQRKLILATASGFQSHTGLGASGSVGGRNVWLGNASLMQQQGIALEALQAKAEHWRQQGASVMFLAVDGALAGLVAVADPIKPSTPEAIAQLHAALQ